MAYRFDPVAFEERKRLAAEQLYVDSIADCETAPLSDGLCYFLGATLYEGDGTIELVKIGYSRHVSQRVNALRSKNPYKLVLLATARGGREREMTYHIRFRNHRYDGEWFHPHADIMAEIERLTA